MIGKRDQIPAFMAVSMPRRMYPFVIAGVVLIALACLTVTFREDSWSSATWKIPFISDDGDHFSSDNGKTRIALIETGGTHDEVSAALMHAFGALKHAEMGVFFRTQRYEMQSIMDKFKMETPIAIKKEAKEFSTVVQDWKPHIIVATTCEFDAKTEAASFRKLLDDQGTHLFCLVHHADRWVNNKWAETAAIFHEKDRLDVIGLSEHTMKYFLNHSTPHWDGGKPVITRILPPVFPVDLPTPDPKAPLSLAMQGDYSSDRRDYKSTFNSLGEVIQAVKDYDEYSETSAETVDLHVIGHGKTPDVPDAVKDRVIFDQSLSYPDFYATLSRAFSMLPSFASDEYYDRKASSTVPASLIAGAPLVANEKLLASYTYLPREAAWVQKDGESEMDTIKRVINDRAELAKKREAVKATRIRLLKENQEAAVEWMEQALEKQKWPVRSGAETSDD